MSSYILGIDIGGTRTKVGIVNEETYEVLDTRVFPTEKYDIETFYRNILAAVDSICSESGIPRDSISGAGVGIGSYIYHEGGTVDSTWGYIPCVDGVALGDELSRRLGVSCIVDNDLRPIALAESIVGEGKGYERVLTITLGTGVGVCLTENGRFTEKEAVTHLAGHIMVRGRDEWIEALDREGCYCPVFGCLENTCSGTSLQKMAKEMVDPEIDNIRLFQRASEEDEAALACLAFFFECLTRGLNQMVYIFSPDVIVLGGGITKGFGPYLDDLQRGLTARVHSGQEPVIRISYLEESSGILGTALLWKMAGRKSVESCTK